MLKRPGEFGASIAVAEGHTLVRRLVLVVRLLDSLLARLSLSARSQVGSWARRLIDAETSATR